MLVSLHDTNSSEAKIAVEKTLIDIFIKMFLYSCFVIKTRIRV